MSRVDAFFSRVVPVVFNWNRHASYNRSAIMLIIFSQRTGSQRGLIELYLNIFSPRLVQAAPLLGLVNHYYNPKGLYNSGSKLTPFDQNVLDLK